jgi:predicted unusual protein kinase regulating ubiquinone biosynthesis (AarF/ABC1/UbiB family)
VSVVQPFDNFHGIPLVSANLAQVYVAKHQVSDGNWQLTFNMTDYEKRVKGIYGPWKRWCS